MNGMTIKAGCLLPFFESCDMLQQIGGDQIRCTSCGFDHCNTITAPYFPGPGGNDGRIPWSVEGPNPYYPGTGRFPQRDCLFHVIFNHKDPLIFSTNNF
uniref:Uncharacterized protein n=1 Tax=Meloidogyne incognita TaxID=6306 RepID=A0A914NMD3_MELIC